ncbi:MAG: twin-arginine translocase TatA/TatE family subunit [Thermoanaerobacterales bacterium]|nr:twin-arginine translocase TatA/TatE family subunit [Bacillota bacterium]MDI6907385.1 twin-arginine translocase TatA/TatE family subunit [Thermoanaerobacterales bacterium]
MFPQIGMPELIIILVVALIIFGPKRLPQVGRSLGKTLSEFRRSSRDITEDVTASVKDVKEEIEGVKSAVTEANPMSAPKPAEGSPAEKA